MGTQNVPSTENLSVDTKHGAGARRDEHPTHLSTELYTETCPSTEQGHRQEAAKRQWGVSEEKCKEYRVKAFILEISHAKEARFEFV